MVSRHWWKYSGTSQYDALFGGKSRNYYYKLGRKHARRDRKYGGDYYDLDLVDTLKRYGYKGKKYAWSYVDGYEGSKYRRTYSTSSY